MKALYELEIYNGKYTLSVRYRNDSDGIVVYYYNRGERIMSDRSSGGPSCAGGNGIRVDRVTSIPSESLLSILQLNECSEALERWRL